MTGFSAVATLKDMETAYAKHVRGFMIVELLIVIVVVAIFGGD